MRTLFQDPLFDHPEHHFAADGFGNISGHPGFHAFFPVSFQRVRRHGNDGNGTGFRPAVAGCPPFVFTFPDLCGVVCCFSCLVDIAAAS